MRDTSEASASIINVLYLRCCLSKSGKCKALFAVPMYVYVFHYQNYGRRESVQRVIWTDAVIAFSQLHNYSVSVYSSMYNLENYYCGEQGVTSYDHLT